MTRRVVLAFAAVGAALVFVWMSVRSTPQVDPRKVDVETPAYVGYDATTKTYQFRVSGSTGFDVRDHDTIVIKFSGPVTFERLRIRSYDKKARLVEDRSRQPHQSSFSVVHARLIGRNDGGATRRFTVDAWIKPEPGQGACYGRMSVGAGYRRTNAEPPTTFWQGFDADQDPELETGRVCRH